MCKISWLPVAMLTILAATAVAQASKSGQSLPSVVSQHLHKFTKTCPNKKKKPAQEAIRWHVWNDAQPPLIVLDASRLSYDCGYAGSAGSPLMIFGYKNGRLSRRGGQARGQWVTSYDSFMAVRDFQLVSAGKSLALLLELHPTYCGNKPGESCSEEWQLDTKTMEFFLVSSRH